MRRFIFMALIATALFSCKKEENKPVTQPANPNDSVSYGIKINSNFKYPYVKIENITDGIIVKSMNTNVSGYSSQVIINYSFYAKNNKRYRVYSYCTKDATDSTLYMLNSKRINNYLRVTKGTGMSSIMYEHTDSVNTTATNEYHINY